MAGQRFDDHREHTGLTDEVAAAVNTAAKFEAAREAGHLWVAAARGGGVVGFALVHELGGAVHLEELDVLPAHGRRGLGSALLEAVCAWAATRGFRRVTLRTFRDVPWNAPFYLRRGFAIVDAASLSAAHAALEVAEHRRGLRVDRRVTMCRTVAAG